MQITVATYNINGIRAGFRKGLGEWLQNNAADIICLQEVKASENDVDFEIITNAGYPYIYWHAAEKKGYSGVAIFSKYELENVITGFTGKPNDTDNEGRILQASLQNLRIINAYFPSGTSGEVRQAFKMEWLNNFEKFAQTQVKKYKNLLIAGDYNIAHHAIDIHDPVGNKNSSGFKPEEREWMTQFLNGGFTDTYRHLNPEKAHQYTWWSQRRPNLRAENKGWRIDYISVSNNLAPQLQSVSQLKDIAFSDHSPVVLTLNNPK